MKITIDEDGTVASESITDSQLAAVHSRNILSNPSVQPPDAEFLFSELMGTIIAWEKERSVIVIDDLKAKIERATDDQKAQVAQILAAVQVTPDAL